MKACLKALVSFALALGFCQAMAAAEDAVSDSVALAEVTVTEVQKLPARLMPLAVTTVTRSEIESDGRDALVDILVSRVPGMFAAQRGVAGYGLNDNGVGTVSIRGVGGGVGATNNRVLFMIDGEPQWAGLFGHSVPDLYNTLEVERVEVVRGPSSLLYGSNAMGGSVNIITRHARQDGLHGGVRALWGSYGSQRYSLHAGLRRGRWNAFVAASFNSSDGHRRDMKYWLASQYAALEYRISRHWRASANISLTESKSSSPGPVYEPLSDYWTLLYRGSASLNVANTYGSASGALRAYANWGRHKIDDGYTQQELPTDYWFRSRDINVGFTAYESFRPWKGALLSAGLDFKLWGGRSWSEMKDGSGDQPQADHSVNETAVYVLAEQDLIGSLLSLNAGVRLEHSSQYGNEWVPQAGFILRPFRGNTLKFSYGKGFRSPNIRELYMYRPANPDLRPEVLHNFEIEWRQSLLDHRLDIGLALYNIKASNLIMRLMVDGRPLNCNTGRFTNRGFEIDGSWRIVRWAHVDASYSFLYSDILLPFAPKHKVSLSATLTPGRWEIGAETMVVAGLHTTEDPSVATESYVTLNLRVAYCLPWLKKTPMKLMVQADNVTATAYQTVYGYPMPRCTVFAGLHVGF